MARRTQRRLTGGYRRASRAGSRSTARRVSRRGGVRRGARTPAVRSAGRAQTIRIVLQQPAAAGNAGSLLLSDAGRLMAPTTDKRSRF